MIVPHTIFHNIVHFIQIYTLLGVDDLNFLSSFKLSYIISIQTFYDIFFFIFFLY